MDRQDLDKAVTAGLLHADQVEPLWQFFSALNRDQPRFDLTHVLYYFGGLVAIGAMTLFMNLGWQQFGGWGIFFISLCYAAAGLLLTNRFLSQGYALPAAVSGAFVVSLVPLAVFALQEALGIWPDKFAYPAFHERIAFAYVYMELATILAATLMLYRYRLAFLMMPLGVSLWYLSMDIGELLLGRDFSVSQMGYVSMGFGGLMLLLSLYVDLGRERKVDFAFWLYLFAVVTFWGGLSVQWSESELAKFGYFSINLLLIATGVLLARRVFVVFGAIGCGAYLSYLASQVFFDSWLFPLTLSGIGLSIVYAGVWWQKNEATFSVKLRRYLPVRMQTVLGHRLV
jgi:hypothetical protein